MRIRKLLRFLLLLPGLVAADFVDFGAATAPVSIQESITHQLPQHGGFRVAEVFAYSPAAELGLRRKDIVTKLNGRLVFSATNLSQLIAATHTKGQQLHVTWRRGLQVMSGRALLNRTSRIEDFHRRYSQTPFSFNSHHSLLPDFTITNHQEQIPAHILEMLEKSGINHLLSTEPNKMDSMVLSKMITTIHTPTGKIYLDARKDGHSKIQITNPRGHIIFDEVITKEQIDLKIPKGFRATIKQNFPTNLKEPTFRVQPIPFQQRDKK